MFQRTFRFKLNDIDHAFNDGQFSLAYQPIISLSDRKIKGAEAFIRWQHPEFGMIAPSLFLTYLDRQGRTAELTEWVIREATANCAVWRQAGKDWYVSVNLALGDVRDPATVNVVRAALKRQKLPAHAFKLELPQSITYLGPDRRLESKPALDHPDKRADELTGRAWNLVQDTIAGLNELGVGVSMDGSGNALKAIEMFEAKQFTDVKFGGATIQQFISADSKTDDLVSPSKLRFAKSQGIETVAVGIQSDTELQALHKAGFMNGQGAFICRPVSFVDLLDWANNLDGLAKADQAGNPGTRALFGERKRTMN